MCERTMLCVPGSPSAPSCTSHSLKNILSYPSARCLGSNSFDLTRSPDRFCLAADSSRFPPSFSVSNSSRACHTTRKCALDQLHVLWKNPFDKEKMPETKKSSEEFAASSSEFRLSGFGSRVWRLARTSHISNVWDDDAVPRNRPCRARSRYAPP